MEQPKGFSLAGELQGGVGSRGAAVSDQTRREVTGSRVVLSVKGEEFTAGNDFLKTLVNFKKCDLKDRTNRTNTSYVPTLHSSRSQIIGL